MGERCVRIAEARGSNPLISTRYVLGSGFIFLNIIKIPDLLLFKVIMGRRTKTITLENIK